MFPKRSRLHLSRSLALVIRGSFLKSPAQSPADLPESCAAETSRIYLWRAHDPIPTQLTSDQPSKTAGDRLTLKCPLESPLSPHPPANSALSLVQILRGVSNPLRLQDPTFASIRQRLRHPKDRNGVLKEEFSRLIEQLVGWAGQQRDHGLLL
ncbi:hypothetical protein DFH06DRAFT_1349188 [Mycena polygramma]|nr:hypothetical protein DFH06DRAFT_1349188 [Mycena polygramma]